MKKIIIILTIIVLAGIGLSNDIESISSKNSKTSVSDRNSDYSYSYSSGSYSSGNYSYSLTCYKRQNKGYHKCSQCSGRGYKTEYISVPNYSGTGSSPSTTVKKDCTNCVDGVQDCRHCYN